MRTSKKTSRVTDGDSSKGTSLHDTDSKLIKYEIVSESNQTVLAKSTTVCCVDISTTRNKGDSYSHSFERVNSGLGRLIPPVEYYLQ